MLIRSDLMVLGTRCYHETGVPSSALQPHQLNSYHRSSIRVGLRTIPSKGWYSGFTKGFAGRWEGGNMQRLVSRNNVLKSNQFLRPSSSALSYRGFRSLGFSGSFTLQPLDKSARFVFGNSRTVASRPGDNGGGSVKVSSGVPRIRPATTRRSFRESGKLMTPGTRQRNISRIGSAGENLSPQRLLDCAVDILRSFNEKVNSLFQRDGVDSGSRDFTSAAEEKAPPNAVSEAITEMRAPEPEAVGTGKPPSIEFEWRSALWEAEVSSALSEADVQVRVVEKTEETLPAAITAAPELQSSENGNVVGSVVVEFVDAVEAKEAEVSLVEELKEYPRNDAKIPALSGSQFSGSTQIENEFVEAVPANGELTSSQNGNAVSTVQETGGVSSTKIEEAQVTDSEIRAAGQIENEFVETIPANWELSATPELQSPENGNVSSVPVSDAVYSVEEAEEVEFFAEYLKEISESGLVSPSSDAGISQVSSSDPAEISLTEAGIETSAAHQTENEITDAIPANWELESSQNGNAVSTVQETDGVSSIEIEEAQVASGLGTDGGVSQLSGSDPPAIPLTEADVKIPIAHQTENTFTEAIPPNWELENLQNGKAVSTVQGTDGVSSVEIEEAAVASGLGTEGEISQSSGSSVPEYGPNESDGGVSAEENVEEAMIESTSGKPELEDLGNLYNDSTLQGSEVASSTEEIREVDISDLWHNRGSGFSSLNSLEPSISRELRPCDFVNLVQPLARHSESTELEEEVGQSLVSESSSTLATEAGESFPGVDIEIVQPPAIEFESGDIKSLSEELTGQTAALEPQLQNSSADVETKAGLLSPTEVETGDSSLKFEEEGAQGYDSESISILKEQITRILREEITEQRAGLEPQLASSVADVENEAGESSPTEIVRADASLKLQEEGVQRYDSESISIPEEQVDGTSMNVQLEILEPSPPESLEGVDTKLSPIGELTEQKPEPSLNLEAQPVNLSSHEEQEMVESSEGRSLEEDGRNIALFDSNEGRESSSFGGQVVREGTGASVGESIETGITIEAEAVQPGSPVDKLDKLLDQYLKTGLSVESAGEAGAIADVTSVTDQELSSKESGALSREPDIDDVPVASEGQSGAGPDDPTDNKTGEMDDLAGHISKLRSSVRHHAYLYHTLDRPSISDAAYDSLGKELAKLETQASNLEPTLDVLEFTEPSPELLKVVHSTPMLSLASVQKEEEVLSWYEKLQQKLTTDKERLGWVVEPKVDGLALSLRYENGKLKRAATRGNGIQGEDVTHNAQRVLGVPLTVPQKLPGTKSPLTVLEVRGEIFMSLKDFNEWNGSKIQSGEKPMTNPRNAAAGSMRLLASNASKLRPLRFMAYNIPLIEVETVKKQTDLEKALIPQTQWEALQLLKSVGFAVNEDNQFVESLDSALEYARSWRSTRRSLEYGADGVVLKVNDLATQASLGNNGEDPRWAIAWKFAATEAVSVLEGIELTIGRSGAIIPNARFKPVELGGVTTSRASLHNFGHVRALGLCEGDHIVVQRAGDVIPQVVQVLEDLRPETAKPWSLPEECPTCGTQLTETSASPMVFCSNPTCQSRHSRQVGHFAHTLISGLGAATLTLLEEQLVKDPADFYDLDEAALSKLKRFGKLSAKKLLKAIEESKQKDFWLFISALGIPRIGAKAAKELAGKFGSLQALLESDVSGFAEVPGIGAATAQGIYDWCQAEDNIDLIRRLEAAGCKVNPSIEIQGKPDGEEDEMINALSPARAPSQTNESVVEPDFRSELQEVVPGPDESRVTPGEQKKRDEALVDVIILPPTTPALQKKSIVITGDFGDENLSREDVKRLVTLHGGNARMKVTSKTSFVLAGNRPGAAILEEAARRGVEVIDYQRFLRLIGQSEGQADGQRDLEEEGTGPEGSMVITDGQRDLREVTGSDESEGTPDVLRDLEVSGSDESSVTPNVFEESAAEAPLSPGTPALQGKNIVITGDFGTSLREGMNKLVTLHGGNLRRTVTSRTSFVLCGNRPGPSKIADASRLGVETVDYESFLSLIGQTDAGVQ